MAVTVEIVSFSLMVVCCLSWTLLFRRNMLVAVRVRLWPGNYRQMGGTQFYVQKLNWVDS
jgi:hypothetical protein